MQCKVTSSEGVQCSRSVWIKSSGMCSAHRSRVIRWGHPGKDIPIRFRTKPAEISSPVRGKGDTEAERFWSLVDKSGNCWLWKGGVCKANGVGQASFNGFNHTAVRIAWLLSRGPVEKGRRVRATCSGHNCVRPEHLELMGSTQQQPMAA